jgi:hypothetical protein
VGRNEKIAKEALELSCEGLADRENRGPFFERALQELRHRFEHGDTTRRGRADDLLRQA